MTDEKQAWRRNLLDWSEDFSKSAWNNNAGVIPTVDAGDLFNGTPTSRVYETSELSQHRVWQPIPVVAGKQYLVESVFKLNGGVQEVRLINTTGGAGLGSNTMIYHVNDGLTVASSSATDVQVENVDNGFVRLRYTVLEPATNDGLPVFGLSFRRGSAEYQGDPTYYVDIAYIHVQEVQENTTYQRTTTHVPRPFAIKDELVTNGTFDTADGWNTGALWTIDNGVATVINGDGAGNNRIMAQFLPIPDALQSSMFELSYEVVASSFSTHNFPIARIVGGANVELSKEVGNHTAILAGDGLSSELIISYYRTSGGGGSWTIDNVSIKEVEYPLTLGNGSHKDFRYYPKTLSANEVEALTA